MALSVLFALFEAIGDTIKEKNQKCINLAKKKHNENIDFQNIASVTFDGFETAYRIETREEFDPVKSEYWTQQDGWAHYETKTVEYEVEDGVNYCFTIRYKNGSKIYRKFHETSWLTEQLLVYCEKDFSAIGDLFNSRPIDGDYKIAFSKFKEMQSLYNLNQDSTKENFEKAAELKMVNIVMSNTVDIKQTIYELMLYLLSTEEDGDILQKVNREDVSFLQETSDGVDAFTVLPNKTNVRNSTVKSFEKTRKSNNYRKVVILTTGEDRSTISNPNIVIWDFKKIYVAYITALKKIVTEA